jgi:hypothetical protein
VLRVFSTHKRTNVAELIQVCDVVDIASRNAKARTCARASELELPQLKLERLERIICDKRVSRKLT